MSDMFNLGQFMPHGICYLWRWDLLILHVGSDALIAGAYFSIPAALLVLTKNRTDIPRGIFLLFVAFILLCGITHLVSIIVTWYPLYYIQAFFKLATAIVSVITAVMLWPLVPKLIEMPSLAAMELRNNEIQALNRQLQNRIDSLSTLAGGVSHEFNNLFTIIMGNTQLLEGQNLNGDGRNQLAAISRASNRAAGVCRQMLAFSGNGHFFLTELDINDTLRHMEIAESPVCRVEMDLSENLEPIGASKEQFTQLVQDLIENSRESIEEARRENGLVQIATFKTELTRNLLAQSAFETSMNPGPAIMLEVKDNGAGMPPPVMERIFEPYFSTKFTGRGLGLAAVQGIIRGHGACLFVESTVGAGSKFRIGFPAIMAKTSQYRLPKSTNPRVVLVVDDEEDILHLARKYLTELGIKTLIASDAQSAIRLVEENKHEIDAVLLDYLMPWISGIQLLAKIHSHIDVDTYLTSGYTRGEISNPEIRNQLTGFIAKPFRREDFVAIFTDQPKNL